MEVCVMVMDVRLYARRNRTLHVFLPLQKRFPNAPSMESVWNMITPSRSKQGINLPHILKLLRICQ